MGNDFRETLNRQLKSPEFEDGWDGSASEWRDAPISDTQYYRLELKNYSTVSFCSFSKSYFGTLEDIRILINPLDEKRKESCGELVTAFRAYEADRTEVTHHAAFREVPLRTPVRLIHRETLVLENHTLEHENIWQCIYKMHCERVETEHLWLECEGCGFRVLTAKFKDLQHENALGGWKSIREDMLWGFPVCCRETLSVSRMSLQSQRKGSKPQRNWSRTGRTSREVRSPCSMSSVMISMGMDDDAGVAPR